MNRKFLVFAVLAFALVLSACGPTTINQAAPESVRTLNVNGIGQVDLTPDIAYIYIGVHDEAATASEAVDANKTHTNSVIAALTKAGVAEKDIRTSNFSIWPSQQYGPDGTISGTVYMVDNTVNVTVREHQCRHRLVAQLLASKSHGRGSTLAAGQGIHHDPAGFAFNQGDVGNVKTAQLINAIGDFEQANLGVEPRVAPQAGVDRIGRLPGHKLVGIKVMQDTAIVRHDLTFGARHEATFGIFKILRVIQLQVFGQLSVSGLCGRRSLTGGAPYPGLFAAAR